MGRWNLVGDASYLRDRLTTHLHFGDIQKQTLKKLFSEKVRTRHDTKEPKSRETR